MDDHQRTRRAVGVTVVAVIMGVIVLHGQGVISIPWESESTRSASDQPRHPIWDVSSELGLMRLELIREAGVACAIAKHDKSDETSGRLFREQTHLCEVQRKALAAVAPVFDRLGDAGQLQGPLYFFEVFRAAHADNGDTGADLRSPITVGVFRTESDCVAVEQFARERYLPTSPCREWQSTKQRLERDLGGTAHTGEVPRRASR